LNTDEILLIVLLDEIIPLRITKEYTDEDVELWMK